MGNSFRPQREPTRIRIPYYPPPTPPDLNVVCRPDMDRIKSQQETHYTNQMQLIQTKLENLMSDQNKENRENKAYQLGLIKSQGAAARASTVTATANKVHPSVKSGQESQSNYANYLDVTAQNKAINKKIESLKEDFTKNNRNIEFVNTNYSFLQKCNIYMMSIYYILVCLLIFIFVINKSFSFIRKIGLIFLVFILPFLLDLIQQLFGFLYFYIGYLLILIKRKSHIKHIY